MKGKRRSEAGRSRSAARKSGSVSRELSEETTKRGSRESAYSFFKYIINNKLRKRKKEAGQIEFQIQIQFHLLFPKRLVAAVGRGAPRADAAVPGLSGWGPEAGPGTGLAAGTALG